MATIRKKQVRFTSKDDIFLLREILVKNPFKNKCWGEIAESITRADFQLDGRRVRERSQLLIDQHKKNNAASLKKSGVDEDYGERETLLDEVLELLEEEEGQKEKERIKKEKEENTAKEIRKRALDNCTPKKGLGDDENCDGTPVKRSASSTNNIIGYLKEKNENEVNLKKEEINIRKEELRLEREKFELDRQERQQKMEAEKQEKKLMLELMTKCIGQRL